MIEAERGIKMKIMVSACLLGENCKYNGGNNLNRSPSCGTKEIYDGSFSGKKIVGQGVFAKILIENECQVIDVEDL